MAHLGDPQVFSSVSFPDATPTRLVPKRAGWSEITLVTTSAIFFAFRRDELSSTGNLGCPLPANTSVGFKLPPNTEIWVITKTAFTSGVGALVVPIPPPPEGRL